MNLLSRRVAHHSAFFSALLLTSSLSLNGFALPDDDAGVAPSPPPSAELTLLTATVPANGVVLLQVTCSSWGGCPSYSVTMQDEMGNTLDGALLDMSAELGELAFAFQPNAELPVGELRISIYSTYGGGNSETVTVVEATSELPSVSTQLSAVPVGDGADLDCPRPGFEHIQYFESHSVRAQLDFEALGGAASQYFYSLQITGEDARRFTSTQGAAVASGEPEEVCFQITATPVLGGESSSIEDTCLSTAELDDLGPRDEALGDLEAVLRQCDTAPTGYEDEWCDFFSPAFTAKSCDDFNVPQCMAARRTCPDGDNPPLPETGTGGTSPGSSENTGGSPDGTASGNSTGSGNGSGSSNSDTASGCSLHGSSKSSGSWATLLALLLGAGALSRTRRNGAEG